MQERFFKALLYQFQKKSYFSGNTVYEEDESADYLYVIKSGEFRLLKRLEEDAGKDAASHNFKVQYHHAKQFNEVLPCRHRSRFLSFARSRARALAYPRPR